MDLFQIWIKGPPATLCADVSSIYTPLCLGGRGYIRDISSLGDWYKIWGFSAKCQVG